MRQEEDSIVHSNCACLVGGGLPLRRNFFQFLLLLGALSQPNAQEIYSGPPFVMNTGSGQALSTQTFEFTLNPGITAPVLQFSFGFATEEEVAPGLFLDSFGASLSRGGNSSSFTLFVADRAGVQWAPGVPGGFNFDPENIEAEPISFPDLGISFGNRVSFQIEARLPLELGEGAYELNFDLFDNQNAAGSAGWFSDVLVVPEPRMTALAFFGTLMILACSRKKR